VSERDGPGRGYPGSVKKLLVVLSLAGAGYAAWRKMEADKAEQDLWAEATDTVR
jgi:hypothetical protein